MPDEIILGMRFMVDQHIHLHADNLSWTWKHDNKTRITNGVIPGNKICIISLTDADQARLTRFLDMEFNLMDQAELGTLKGIEYEIELNDYTPTHVKPYRRSPRVTEALHKIIEQLLDQKIIQPSNSEYSFQPATPERFPQWKIVDGVLYYYRPRHPNQLFANAPENWKEVVQPEERIHYIESFIIKAQLRQDQKQPHQNIDIAIGTEVPIAIY
ncbi:Protein of unknown function [Cotesia congregata]|uniref:Uncharacterized protein n=1 Tax=Cotesia congregata TaxID=51543 RepID=A0A8J2HEB5_COTCN|nr:Protein of unknown function [Cotesia congregata]